MSPLAHTMAAEQHGAAPSRKGSNWHKLGNEFLVAPGLAASEGAEYDESVRLPRLQRQDCHKGEVIKGTVSNQ
jgi:hypothetical protein